MKDKAKKMRSATHIVYQKEIGVFKYKLSMEEDVLIQQLGLNMFLSIIT